MAHIDFDGKKYIPSINKISPKDDKFILGESRLNSKQLANYAQMHCLDVIEVTDIAKTYILVGKQYGVRGDIAFCQAALETGWFNYTNSAVTKDQHNYWGCGVIKRGMKGDSFDTIYEGVTAHIQHLYAYATTKPLNKDIVDPRFKYVNRGCAPTWQLLGGKWSSVSNYGNQILEIFKRIEGAYNG